MRHAIVLISFFSAGLASAQQSANLKLTEHVVNAGGAPAGGAVLASTHLRITLDSIGEDAVSAGLASASLRMDASFAGAYRPPGEVASLVFDDKSTLRWGAERSAGRYDVYRDLVSALPALGFGACFQPNLGSATATDASTPGTGQGYFYLVTAENRLGEEGTKGFQSNGSERGNDAPCP